VALAAVFCGRARWRAWRQGRTHGAVQPALEIAVGLTVAWIAGGLALATV
jgi:hypothetical protein